MENHYTVEKHTQILISLLKFHGVKKIVASPGTTNICFIGSIQQDSYFEMYSSVDERSAAYIACGLARESGEPVALSCTGATASRNYVSGLTEAYYSNLPVIAITSSQSMGRIGQMHPQMIDRRNTMNDIVKKSVHIDPTHSLDDELAVGVAINDAILESKRHGGGPVHINLETTYSKDFSVLKLPNVRGVNRYLKGEKLPEIKNKRVVIYVGAHDKWSKKLTEKVDKFCEKYNAVVIGEHISNYKGKYGATPALLANQQDYRGEEFSDVHIIHIGTIEGDGASSIMRPRMSWRVHPDGEVRDRFHCLEAVFEMEEEQFFGYYVDLAKGKASKTDYAFSIQGRCASLEAKIPELPLSNPWIAKHSMPLLPEGCEVYLGILNTLRGWSVFQFPSNKDVTFRSNTGGFGIDGLASAVLGASLSNVKKLHFGIIGDLAFFYDMNSIGNRHVTNNLRIMVINNGRGTEFRNYHHPGALFGEAADQYMAAAGHYGNKSADLIRHYATDLGFEYLCASSKKEFLTNASLFFMSEEKDKPVIFEVFTETKDESDALYMVHHLESNASASVRKLAKQVLGEKGTAAVVSILHKKERIKYGDQEKNN